ncbi:HXXXD-type acyl-transferase family protein [Tanacetum coccineum]
MGSIIKEPPQEELGSIRCLRTLREILTKAKTKDQGLLFTELMVNDKKTLGLIDTSAAHNFLDIKEVARLGVKCTPEEGKIKSVNSEPKQIIGTAKVKVCIDKWNNELTFTVVPIDDYRMVLVSQVTTLKRQSEIQTLLSTTQFKKAAKEREYLLATVRKSFDDETLTHPRPSRLFKRKKEWHAEANETRMCLDNAVKRIKKLGEWKKFSLVRVVMNSKGFFLQVYFN